MENLLRLARAHILQYVDVYIMKAIKLLNHIVIDKFLFESSET